MNALANKRETVLLESGNNEVEFIEFFLNDVSYGINVSKVQRVLAFTSVKVNRVAQAPHCTLGMIHIHGKPVVLMDLKLALGIRYNPEEIDPSRQLILVTTFNKQTTAFLIDGISKIHRTSWDSFEQMSEKVGSETQGGFSTGTVTLEDKIIIILDLERIMLTYFPNTHSHSIDEFQIAERAGREAIRIVYAEDSRMVRNMTEKVMRASGYQNIVSFENGSEAYEHIKNHYDSEETPIDLILTDIEMPKMDGLTLCRNIKSGLGLDQPPKVIVYSSLINKEMALKCKSVGADAQLAKPEIEMIVGLIDELCLATEA